VASAAPEGAGRWSRLDAIAIGLLALAPWLFYWPLFAPGSGRRYFEGGDFVDQFVAFTAHEVRSLAAGQLPLWNPYAYGGAPFWADIQAAVAYPISLANVLLQLAMKVDVATSAGLLRLFGALQAEAVLHLALAGVFTYLFARRVLASRAGALVAALSFMLGGYLTGYPPLQLAVLETVTWLPLTLLAVEWVLDGSAQGRAGALRGALLLALALGLTILAGHPQSTLYVLAIATAWAGWRLWPWRAAGRRPALLALVAGLIGGLALAAAGWLPAWQLFGLSNRAAANYDSLANGFPPGELLGLLLPGITKWAPLYLGVLPLLLAVVAVADAVRPAEGADATRRQARFWCGLGLLALLLALGRHAFAFDLFYAAVPGFNLFRGQERAALAVSFSLALLAGHGTALWLAGDLRARRILANGALALAAVATLLALTARPELRPPALRLLFMAGGVALLAAASARPRASASWLLAGALCLIGADLYLANSAVNLVARPPDELRRDLLADDLTGTAQRVDLDDALAAVEPFRPNVGVLHGFEATSGASPLRLRTADTLRRLAERDTGRWWDLLGTSQVVTPRGELPRPAEERRGYGEAARLWYLPQHTPTVWRANSAERPVDDEAALARLADPAFDPLATVLLTDGDPGGPHSGRAGVGLSTRRPGEVVAETFGDAPGWVVFSEMAYPGWQATVDGQAAPILRADLALMAVPVPAGTHAVRLWFGASWVLAGLALSLLAAAILVAAALWVGFVAPRRLG
jgi:hypothetical protein